MQILKIIFIVLEVLVLFNLLILVHELGHFLAARWRGLKVERFGIWFGKPLWQKEINGVVYCLGSIPAGGYVALPQMAPMEAIEGKSETGDEGPPLPPISPLDKIIVAFAGPLFSFGLAFVFALMVWGIGRPVSEREITTVVGYVPTNAPAYQAGLRPGDRILRVDGHEVSRFAGIGDSIMWRIWSSEGDTIAIDVERDGAVLQLESGFIRSETGRMQRRSLRQIGVAPQVTALVARVESDSPAARAGLQRNDVVLEVDGEKLWSPQGLRDHVAAKAPGAEVNLTLLRDDQRRQVTVRPEMPIYDDTVPLDERQPLIGLAWDLSGRWTVDRPGPVRQIQMSVGAMVSTFRALFSSKSDIGAQHLSGPVGIMRIYYVLFESEQGWRQAIWFSVILNVNLALLNLLPIPVLDGGHILLALLEWIRRRPVGLRPLLIIQNACALLIIGYMLYVTFFDVQDLPWKRSKPPEIRFAPRDPPPDEPSKTGAGLILREHGLTASGARPAPFPLAWAGGFDETPVRPLPRSR
jgi:regulator of sigma E protease